MIAECVKEGFGLVNKNLQLVLVRIIVTVINLIGFFIFLGIPVIAAIAYLGLDIAGAKDLWPFLLDNPLGFMSRYLGLLILIITAFLCYLMFSSTLILYALSGSLGVLRNASVNLQYKFSLPSFFQEAKRNFFPLLWVMSYVLLALTILLLAFMLIAGVVMAGVQMLSGSGTTIEMFLRSFIVISGVILGALAFIAFFVLSIFSVLACVTERAGAMNSIKRAAGFLKDRPLAFLYCILLFAGAVFINILFYGLKIPFSMLPLIGPVMNIFMTLAGVVFQSYILLALWASLVAYYIKVTEHPVYAAEYEI